MLDIRFATKAGRVLVSCDEHYVANLQELRARFASAGSINNQAFDIDTDDLLLNLRELGRWPSDDQDVRWQRDLLTLVEGNARDGETLQRQLKDAGAVLTTNLTQALGSRWIAALTDFQRRDLGMLLNLVHGANFSVPGAGKTRVALGVYEAKRVAGAVSRLLVVSPKAAFESWQIEASLCFKPSPSISIMDSSVPPSSEIVLLNYERLPDAIPSLLSWLRAKPTLMVLDEAHRMKLGPRGAWGAACLTLGPYALGRLILTGTPAPNGAKDLENLLAFVWPGQGRATVATALAGNDLRTASRILKPLYTRTTKRELQLPPVDRYVRRVELPALHRKLYDALLGQSAGIAGRDEQSLEALGRVLLYLLMAATTPALLATGTTRHEPLPYRIPPLQPPLGSSLAELMRDLPHYELSPKYREVLDIVASNAANGRKTLVWSTFVRNLRSLEVLLARFSPAIVHGGTEDRAEQLDRFRNDPKCFVLLSNPATLGEGVSLHQVCHDAVYVDRDFAAGRFLQSLDRIHRLGLPADARTSVTVLIANGTIDELVEQRLAAKIEFMGGVLDDTAILELADLNEEPSIAAGMDQGDLAALLRYLSSNVAG